MLDPAPTVAERVVIERPEHMSLLGLLMRDLLAANMANARKFKRARKLAGDVLVKAGEMVVTLRFADGRITIFDGDRGESVARVAGNMPGLLAVVTGNGLVRRALPGVRPGGNLLFLLRMLPLIRAPRTA
ncbi:hypothetical protein K8I61_07230 [bacterium]|nr:hypothetical protein [bacterium]